MTQTVQAAIQDLQDQIDSITFTFATSIAPKSVNANQVNASSLQALTSQTGTLTVNDGGSVASGQSQYNTGTGFFLGTNGGVAQMSLGNPSGNNMTWDGTSLTITGSVNATTGTIGGWTIGTTTLSATNLVLDAGNDIITFTVPPSTYAAIKFLPSAGGSYYTAVESSGTATSSAGYLLSTGNGNAIVETTSSASGGTGVVLIAGSSQVSLGTDFLITTAAGANLQIVSGGLITDRVFFPGTGSATQGVGSISWNTTNSAMKVTAPSLELTGQGGTTAIYIDNCDTQGVTPSASLPAGTFGFHVTVAGKTGFVPMYI